jgi:DNA helicase-2/ATP-dependent DNA helicase PcrA
MQITEDLNNEQREAVTTTDGPLLIFAGAGSGKTRVITHRIAYLIHRTGVAPVSIFAVTFTNRAAEEMRNRIVQLTGPVGKDVFIKTFHSASVYILRNHGDRIDIPRSFTIYDRQDQESVVKKIIKDELKMDPKRLRPSTLVSRISSIKDRAEFVEGTDISSLMPEVPYISFPELFDRYHQILRENRALDFNDLIIETVRLFREAPEVLESLQRRWRYFMVDEYQDTNYAQYLMVRYLSSASQNLCVVGDDDQSIYSWRGADIRNILNFEKDFSRTRTVTLNRNYRSAHPILHAAASVIKNNFNRKDKDLQSVVEDGEPVTIVRANNEYGEAEYVVNRIISLKLRERFSNIDFAIFYRTNAQSRVFEDVIRRASLSYRIIGGLKFYDRKEIKDLLAYMKCTINPDDSVALGRIINTPSRGIGDATIGRINEAARQEGITPWKAVEKELVPGRVPAGLTTFRKLMLQFMEMAREVPDTRPLSSFVTELYELSGYREMLDSDPGIESLSRKENIEELVNSVYEYERNNPESTVEQFLQEISLLTSEDTADMEERRDEPITLMTVHNAKGLEFPVVFLTGMEEDTFPHRLSMDTEEGLEEERRLCYVGMTRAKERLYITSAELRRSFNEVYRKEPSRFLDEIESDNIRHEEFGPDGTAVSHSSFTGSTPSPSVSPGRQRNRFSSRTSSPSPADKGERVNSSPAKTGDNGSSRFSLNQRITHPKYGPGRILTIQGSGDNVKLTIAFPSGRKTFMEKYTPLEPAD